MHVNMPEIDFKKILMVGADYGRISGGLSLWDRKTATSRCTLHNAHDLAMVTKHKCALLILPDICSFIISITLTRTMVILRPSNSACFAVNCVLKSHQESARILQQMLSKYFTDSVALSDRDLLESDDWDGASDGSDDQGSDRLDGHVGCGPDRHTAGQRGILNVLLCRGRICVIWCHHFIWWPPAEVFNQPTGDGYGNPNFGKHLARIASKRHKDSSKMKMKTDQQVTTFKVAISHLNIRFELR